MNAASSIGGAVDYGPLDRFKRQAQAAAAATIGNLRHHKGWAEVSASRGESAYLLRPPVLNGSLLAHVHEGLGTKALVADAMQKLTGKSYYANIARCALGTVVNDVLTSGALPVSVAMNLSVESAEWFSDETRAADLIRGWQEGCDLAGCVWGGGETPQLKDIVVPGAIELSGSALGHIAKESQLLTEDNIEHGDDIYLFESNGIHANGLTDARRLTDVLPEGYLTLLGDGRTYGEHLLDPSRLYASVLRACFEAGVDVHYAVNVTGHGWRKLMRPTRRFTYLVEWVPAPHAVFQFVRERAHLSDERAYATFNMGVGFVLYAAHGDRAKMSEVLRQLRAQPERHAGHRAGSVIEDGKKRVWIKPLRVVYEADTLQIR